MILTIVIIALVSNLLTAILCLCLGATIVYRVRVGLPPVQMPSFRREEIAEESEPEDVGVRLPDVKT